MKFCLGLFLAWTLIVNFFSSPLIFKTSKRIDSLEFVDLGTVDTSKYRQIRVTIQKDLTDKTPPQNFTSHKYVDSPEYGRLIQLRAQFTASLENLKRQNANTPEVTETQNFLNDINKKINDLKEAEFQNVSINILGVEDADENILLGYDQINMNKSFLIDTPPTKIKILVKGFGTFKVFVYGQ